MSDFISGTEARQMIETQSALLIDVRNPPEFQAGTAPGAINVPVNLIPHKAKEINVSLPVIVFCRSGARSSQAQMILQGMGFVNVKNAGGLQDYLNS